MKRKEFLQKALLGFVSLSAYYNLSAIERKYTYFTGNKTKKRRLNMNNVYHQAKTRGHANYGWLDTHHTFSFANYHNPDRMQFGALRVLNDDIIKGGTGFATHPHDNMEIISIPLEGSLEHKDSMGNKHIIKKDEVQIMSAGTGILHSEYNRSQVEDTNFLQIWVFPKVKNIQPRYDQAVFNPKDRINKWKRIVSPQKDDGSLWINQDAFFSLARIEKNIELNYDTVKSENGIYIFVIDGQVHVVGKELNRRDGIGIWLVKNLQLKANIDSDVLLMEVPMV